MRKPKHITLFPLGMAVCLGLLILLAFLPFFWGATRNVASNHTLLFGFHEENNSGHRAFLEHEVDDHFYGMKFPVYPRARVDIFTDATWYAPSHPRRGSRSNLFALYSSVSFVIRIDDGEDTESWGLAWDYPPMHLRKSQEITKGSMLGEAIESMPADQQQLFRDVFTGMPVSGDPIPEPRQAELIDALCAELDELGYQWIHEGIDGGTWTSSGANIRGWVSLGIGIIGIVFFSFLVERLQSKRAKRA